MKPVRLFRAKKNSNHIAGDSLFLPVVHLDCHCPSVELVHQLATQPGLAIITLHLKVDKLTTCKPG